MKRLLAILAVVGAAMATPAVADPCKAVPDKLDEPVPSWLRPGSTFAGLVKHIGDGDGICVQARTGALGLVEVRLADFYAPEAKDPGGPEATRALQRIASGRWATCKAQHRSWDRVVAICKINGVSLGDRMRAAGIREGGRGR